MFYLLYPRSSQICPHCKMLLVLHQVKIWHSEPSECVETVKTKGADVEHSIFLLIYHWMLKLEGGHRVRSLHYEQMLYDLSVLMIRHGCKESTV